MLFFKNRIGRFDNFETKERVEFLEKSKRCFLFLMNQQLILLRRNLQELLRTFFSTETLRKKKWRAVIVFLFSFN
jgi:hypothetical protein